jgi:hypothetical protein
MSRDLRTIKQLFLDDGDMFPKAKIKGKDFYLDDLISGKQSISEAKEIIVQTTNLFDKGGMQLRKWSSNNSTILNNISKSIAFMVMLSVLWLNICSGQIIQPLPSSDVIVAHQGTIYD